MKNILSVVLLSLFLASGAAFANSTTQKNYPLLDVTKLENFKLELSDKQKWQLNNLRNHHKE